MTHKQKPMTGKHYDFTANTVREVAESFLRLHYGDRCPDFEWNCECCRKWSALDVLLRESETVHSLEGEIKALEQAIQWRRELQRSLKPN